MVVKRFSINLIWHTNTLILGRCSWHTKHQCATPSGSESRSNFVCLFSAACVVKPLHTSRRCSLLYQTVVRCDRIVRQLVVISSYREHSPRLSALVGLRSLDRLHGTHSQHTWKTKICLPQSSDLNSKLTCLIPRTFVSSIYVSPGYSFDC